MVVLGLLVWWGCGRGGGDGNGVACCVLFSLGKWHGYTILLLLVLI